MSPVGKWIFEHCYTAFNGMLYVNIFEEPNSRKRQTILAFCKYYGIIAR